MFSGNPQCSVDTGGQAILLADNQTQSTLTCSAQYGPGTSGPDIPSGQITVEWNFASGSGQGSVQGKTGN